MRHIYLALIGVILSIVYVSTVLFVEQSGPRVSQSADRVVVSAPVQTILFMGDRYLASNIEVFRVASTGMTPRSDTGSLDGLYLLRAYQAASMLNPCQEDAYYLANSVLAFGGGYEQANQVLRRASECRFWDFLPPFLYGFNEYFFLRNVGAAQKAIEEAASRSDENRVVLQRFAIMIGVEEFDDEQMALQYLRTQYDEAPNERLRRSLMDRIIRIEGLIELRRAADEYEERFERRPVKPGDLVESGIIAHLPEDPLRLGYEFRNGEFFLREFKVSGVERPE